jgi:nitric oxide reductase NorQ protein
MAYRLRRPLTVIRDVKTSEEEADHGLPLVTVACHEDLTASDLTGRYLLEGESIRWIDGPLTRAVKAGAICYLDEIVERARTPPSSSTLSPPYPPIEKLGRWWKLATASCW